VFVEKKTILNHHLYMKLCFMYLQGIARKEAGAPLLTLGLHDAQTTGVHKRHFRENTLSKSEREMRKRAFWCLVAADAMMSAATGRGRILNPLE
jgi:hypothetical protein